MKLHDLFLIIADCATIINLTDKKGHTIHYKRKMDFDSSFDTLEINIDYEVINYAKESK